MARWISPLADEVCLAPLTKPRGASIKDLMRSFKGVKGPVRTFMNAQEALANAIHDTPKEGLVIVTGSLALVGEILAHV